MDSLPPLREIVRKYKLSAQKQLGQHFLFDLQLAQKIAASAGPLEDRIIVEIGPGPGALTRALLTLQSFEGGQKIYKVIVIEQDERFLAPLQEIAAAYPGKLEIIIGNALTYNFQNYFQIQQQTFHENKTIEGEGEISEAMRPPCFPKIQIVANLPYNISTRLLVQWLSLQPWPPWFEKLTLMFQKEVAERICATPSQRRHYGRLSVLAHWRCHIRRLFDVAPESFVPPPKVTSTVVELIPRAAPLMCDPALLSYLTAVTFGQRRKMLRKSLRNIVENPELLCALAQVVPESRPEEIPVERFVALAQELQKIEKYILRAPEFAEANSVKRSQLKEKKQCV